jgi:hypothetical protein
MSDHGVAHKIITKAQKVSLAEVKGEKYFQQFS